MKLDERQYDFSVEKNHQMVQQRGIGFEDVIVALQEEGCLLDIIEHPNKEKYGHQKIYVININDYVYLVPFVEKNASTIFLKTVFPSRKLTKKYLGKYYEKKANRH